MGNEISPQKPRDEDATERRRRSRRRFFLGWRRAIDNKAERAEHCAVCRANRAEVTGGCGRSDCPYSRIPRREG